MDVGFPILPTLSRHLVLSGEMWLVRLARKKKALFFAPDRSPRQGGMPPLAQHRATRQTADRFFRCKFMTARESDESPEEESSAERWSRKAVEQARQNAAQGEPTDEPDFSSMPQFDTFEEGNAWVLEQIGEWYVRKCGRWQLFQNSRRLPGFKEAEESWKRASGEFLRREGVAILFQAQLILK